MIRMTNDELGALSFKFVIRKFVIKNALLEKQNGIIFAFSKEHFCYGLKPLD